MPSTLLSFRGRLPVYGEEARAAFELHRKEEITAISGKMLRIVKNNIVQSGVQDSKYTLRNMQTFRYGSKGGYVVVEPYKTPKGNSGPGAITWYNEVGHKTRMPSGKAERYKPEVRKYKTTAFEFYESAQPVTHRLLDEAMERICDAVAKALEDG